MANGLASKSPDRKKGGIVAKKKRPDVKRGRSVREALGQGPALDRRRGEKT